MEQVEEALDGGIWNKMWWIFSYGTFVSVGHCFLS